MTIDHYLNNTYHPHVLNWKGKHCKDELLVWLYTDNKSLINEWTTPNNMINYTCRYSDKIALKAAICDHTYWFVKLQLGTKCYENLKNRGWKDVPKELLNKEVTI